MITSLDKTSYDPIARKLRHDLKSVADYKKIMVVTSREEPVKQNVLGSNAYVPAVAGLYLAYYVIKEVLHD